MSRRDDPPIVGKLYGKFETELAQKFMVNPVVIGMIRGEFFAMPEGSTQADFAMYLGNVIHTTRKPGRKARAQECLNFVASASSEMWEEVTKPVTTSSGVRTFVDDVFKQVGELFDEVIDEVKDEHTTQILVKQRRKIEAMITGIPEGAEELSHAQPTEN